MEMEKFYVAPEVEVLNGKVLCGSGSGSSGGKRGKGLCGQRDLAGTW